MELKRGIYVRIRMARRSYIVIDSVILMEKRVYAVVTLRFHSGAF